MHILISNDDGYRAPGIRCLADTLQTVGAVTVVAPDRDRSGASNSLTLDNPLRARQAANGYTYVEGTPTDCVHLAITGLLEEEPDMVISGINAGANLGDDVIYSGTVAAAMEGRRGQPLPGDLSDREPPDDARARRLADREPGSGSDRGAPVPPDRALTVIRYQVPVNL